MDHFEYRNGTLYAEDVAITDIANQIGTPFYCYSHATLVRHYHVFADAFDSVNAKICFAVKANSNLAYLATLASEGAGADCVSEGEIRKSLLAGMKADDIVFSGVGKTATELAYALEQTIHQFNVESEAELLLLNDIAISKGVKAPIAIRVNPDVDAGTHNKISTGRKEDKFGIAWEQVPAMYAKAHALEGIDVVGVSTHIGSQLTELEPFQKAFEKVKNLVLELRAQGIAISRLDLGGGLGIPYHDDQEPPSPAEYGKMVIDATRELDCELIFEPGRLIAGNTGILVTSVVYRKDSPHRSFAIVDAAMNDLMRPALYDAHHTIIPVAEHAGDMVNMDVVGPVCETTDVFGKDRPLPDSLDAGDLLAFRSAGAYGAVMSNTYNQRLMVPEVMVNGNQFAVIRPRQSYEELFAGDVLPGWLE